MIDPTRMVGMTFNMNYFLKFWEIQGKIYQHGLQESIKQTIKSYLEKHDLVLVKKSDLKTN